MRSRISCFDMGIARNLARRYWPLWAAYLAAMTVFFPLELTAWGVSNYAEANARVLTCALNCVRVAIPAGAAMAMAMFSFMYSSRSVSMMCSLPIRRETMYLTALLCGLLPMLMADVIAAIMGAVVVSGWAYVEPSVLAQALGIIVMETVAFYGFAVFCAQLTGNLLVLPLVYLLLNVSVYAMELGIRYLLSNFVYGMTGSICTLTALSPIIYMLNIISVSWNNSGTADVTVEGSSVNMPQQRGWTIHGLTPLYVYCAAGILLALLALLLYRRRRMETATDAVAIPLLRPLFKYCMSFGGAVVFTYLIYANFGLRHAFVGLSEAFVLFALMAVGAAIGYYLAKMLIEKTLRVFSGKPLGLFVSIGIIACFIFSWELDLYGYERRVPELDEVEAVTLTSPYYYIKNGRLCEEENIAQVLKLHQRMINEKKSYERRNYERYDGIWFTLKYELKDGGRLERNYYLLETAAELEDKNSEIWLVQDILRSSEFIRNSYAISSPVTPQTIESAYIYYYNVGSSYRSTDIELSAEDAYELYTECMLPDMEDGNLGFLCIVPQAEYELSISICVRRTDAAFDWIEVGVSEESTRTLEWMRKSCPKLAPFFENEVNGAAS